jgi:hypothetical protein
MNLWVSHWWLARARRNVLAGPEAAGFVIRTRGELSNRSRPVTLVSALGGRLRKLADIAKELTVMEIVAEIDWESTGTRIGGFSDGHV